MLFVNNKKKIVLPTLLATVTLFSACSRMQVVPEDEQASPIVVQPPIAESPLPAGTVIVPPVITQPAEMPVNTANNNTHIVQAGEGLYGIARTYSLNFKDLAAWNQIPAPYTAINPGQVLILSPVAGATGVTTATGAGVTLSRLINNCCPTLKV